MAVIYGLTDPRTGEVRYIGKANDAAKRLQGHLRDERRRQTPLYSWVRKLAGREPTPRLIVLEVCGADWREPERRLIATARARGDRILNLADGGDQPFCSAAVRSANGQRLVAKIREDDQFRRFWHLKRDLQRLLRDGLVANHTRAKMRAAAASMPLKFGTWAGLPDRDEDENGQPVGGYGRVKGNRYGAPIQALA
jgi:hypothetical protein